MTSGACHLWHSCRSSHSYRFEKIYRMNSSSSNKNKQTKSVVLDNETCRSKNGYLGETVFLPHTALVATLQWFATSKLRLLVVTWRALAMHLETISIRVRVCAGNDSTFVCTFAHDRTWQRFSTNLGENHVPHYFGNLSYLGKTTLLHLQPLLGLPFRWGQPDWLEATRCGNV